MKIWIVVITLALGHQAKAADSQTEMQLKQSIAQQRWVLQRLKEGDRLGKQIHRMEDGLLSDRYAALPPREQEAYREQLKALRVYYNSLRLNEDKSS